jgi:hypothetical protein
MLEFPRGAVVEIPNVTITLSVEFPGRVEVEDLLQVMT